MSHSSIEVVLKISATNVTIAYLVSSDWSTSYFLDQVPIFLREHFNILDPFYLVPFEEGYEGSLEDNCPLLISQEETIGDYCQRFTNIFYLNFQSGEAVKAPASALDNRELETEGSTDHSNNEKVTTTTNPTTTEEQSTDHSSIRTVENTNGMSHCIYGQSHWTDEDYRDELRSLNQSLRD